MKLNKTLSMVSALSLMAVSLAACGGGNNSGNASPSASGVSPSASSASPSASASGSAATGELKPEEGAKLLVWESKDERVFTDEIAAEFTEKYGVPVEIAEVAPTDQVTRLSTDGPSDLGADVVIFPHDHLGRAVTGNLVLENDVFGDVTKQENSDSAITGVTYNGKIYGYPRAAETYALYYNKSLVKEAPKTWDDVLAISKTLTDAKKNKFGIEWEVGNFYFNYPFIASTGGYLYGSNGTDKNDIGINNDGAVQSMTVYKSLKEVLPVKAADITPDIKRGQFTAGDIAMDINGPWELAGYKAALGDNLGVAPLPSFGDKPSVSFSGVKAWYVSSYTKYPNAAKLFARFASTKDAQLKLNKLVGSVPTNKEAQNDPQVKDDPVISAFVTQFNNSQPMPSIPEMNNAWSPAGAALTEIWDNGKDPKAALDAAAQQIKDLNNGTAK
ncbi:maltose ABC transporter substrate-binding protein [Cohnella thermotolerans]|uniref:sugar ABC transporter substrate-binding protein n=1 Tax=Cohnella thermotolerans TaxID=329858 RepID=UPI00047B2F81|nr:maltose ABC transporter substrate-binding protein [Cohnella thermotolerans]